MMLTSIMAISQTWLPVFQKQFTVEIFMIGWLKQLLSGSEGASTKRVAYMMVVIATILWLSFEQHSKAFSDAWVEVFKALLWIVGSVNLGGKAIDIIPSSKNSQKEGDPS